MSFTIDPNLINMASVAALQSANAKASAASATSAQQAQGTDFKSVLLDEVSSLTGKTVDLDAIFEKAANTYNVPVKLLKAMAKAESNFNVNAVSSCGAQGIMQLMPETAAALGVSDSFDPEQNIMGGAKYISQKLDKYDGDITLALAAYQAGSGNVAKYGGVPPFKSTQTYIDNIYRYMNEDITAGSTTVENNSYQTGSTEYVEQNPAMSFYQTLAVSGLLDEYLMLKAFTASNDSSDLLFPYYYSL